MSSSKSVCVGKTNPLTIVEEKRGRKIMPAIPAKSSAWVPLQAASTPTVDTALASGAAIIHPVSSHCGGAHPATRAGAAAPGIVIREMRPCGGPCLRFRYGVTWGAC